MTMTKILSSIPKNIADWMPIVQVVSTIATSIIGELISGTSLSDLERKPVGKLAGWKACRDRIMKPDFSKLLAEVRKYKDK